MNAENPQVKTVAKAHEDLRAADEAVIRVALKHPALTGILDAVSTLLATANNALAHPTGYNHLLWESLDTVTSELERLTGPGEVVRKARELLSLRGEKE